MPGPTMWRGQVAKWAKIAGKLDQEDIDKCALRVLKVSFNPSWHMSPHVTRLTSSDSIDSLPRMPHEHAQISFLGVTGLKRSLMIQRLRRSIDVWPLRVLSF